MNGTVEEGASQARVESIVLDSTEFDEESFLLG